MELEKFGVNSFIFDKLDSGKGVCIVEYPTKQKQGWYFWVIYGHEKFELDISKKERLAIIGEVRNINPSNLWEDTTDWANARCY